MKYLIITLILILSCLHVVFAQQVPQSDSSAYEMLLEKIDKMEQEMNTLKQEMDQQKEELSRQKQEDELEELLREAGQLAVQEEVEADDLSKKFHTGIRQQQGLNPNISVGGDFFGAASSSKSHIVTDPSEFANGSNGMHMRGLEMSFVSTLDPFARGKAFLHLHDEGLEVEEAYMELLNLPLQMNLKAGKFFAEYGLMNRYHEHALPQFDRPRVAVNYFGTENLGGTGLAGSFMLPQLLFADASSLDLTFVEGGQSFSFTEDRRMNFLYFAHLKNYYDLSESSYFEYTLSGVAGRNDTTGYTNSFIGSLGLHYKWEPPSRSKYRTFDLKAEFYYGFMENRSRDVRSKGFYVSFQNKLNARFWIAGRMGYSELPYDNTQSEWDYTLCFDYWQSEFVFFRLQYQYNDRSISNMLNSLGPYPDDHSVVLQVSWAMGPHKHEAY